MIQLVVSVARFAAIWASRDSQKAGLAKGEPCNAPTPPHEEAYMAQGQTDGLLARCADTARLPAVKD